MSKDNFDFIPCGPSLCYPATAEEKREAAEEKADKIITVAVSALLEDVCCFGLSREEAIGLIKDVFNRELKQ